VPYVADLASRSLYWWIYGTVQPVPEHLAARLEHAAARGFALATRYALLVMDETAEDAASLVELDYEPLPAVVDARQLAKRPPVATRLLIEAVDEGLDT
jgi:CO/xanthine dehydrogenase Mo-binding subunit